MCGLTMDTLRQPKHVAEIRKNMLCIRLFVFITVYRKALETAVTPTYINPLNAELNPICHLLALLAHHILHISRTAVNSAGGKMPECGTARLSVASYWETGLLLRPLPHTRLAVEGMVKARGVLLLIRKSKPSTTNISIGHCKRSVSCTE